MIGRDKSTKVTKVEGTMYFYAPEMCDDSKVEDEYEAFPLDIWALGVTTFAMVYLRLPFIGSKNNYYDLINNIMTNDVIFPEDQRQISPELKNIIEQMLIKDPKKRVTCANLKANRWLFDQKLENPKESFHETFKVTDEEIQQSLDFFISRAKNRNYELIWKARTKKIVASNSLMMASALRSSNSINLSSNKSLNSKHSFANDSKRNINLGRFGSIQEPNESNYFKSAKSIGIPKQVNEDDFFDN